MLICSLTASEKKLAFNFFKKTDGALCSCNPLVCDDLKNCCSNVNDVCSDYTGTIQGDTLEDAIVISKVPYANEGTTTGNGSYSRRE